MRRVMKGLLILLFLAGLLFCEFYMDEREEGAGMVIRIPIVGAPPGNGGCATCGKLIPSIRGE